MNTIRNIFTRISTFWNDFLTGFLSFFIFQRKQRAEALQELRAQVEEPKVEEEQHEPEPPTEIEPEAEANEFDVWDPPNLPESFVWDDIPTRADMEAAANEMRGVHITQVRRGQALQRMMFDLANIMADSAQRVRGLMSEMENL